MACPRGGSGTWRGLKASRCARVRMVALLLRALTRVRALVFGHYAEASPDVHELLDIATYCDWVSTADTYDSTVADRRA